MRRRQLLVDVLDVPVLSLNMADRLGHFDWHVFLAALLAWHDESTVRTAPRQRKFLSLSSGPWRRDDRRWSADITKFDGSCHCTGDAVDGSSSLVLPCFLLPEFSIAVPENRSTGKDEEYYGEEEKERDCFLGFYRHVAFRLLVFGLILLDGNYFLGGVCRIDDTPSPGF